MAKIIKNNNEPPTPENDSIGSSVVAVVFLIITVICGFIFFFNRSYTVLIVGAISFFICFVAFLMGISLPKYTPAYKRYGNLGEKITGSILERYLPDNYTVIQNCIVQYDGRTSEIDNIVIGKTGVFVVEVKNMKGTITGDIEEQYWLQDKIDRYDIEHEKEFYNPVKQVGTHIYRLANYLRDNKVFTHIKGAVYFINSDSYLSISGEKEHIKVFSASETRNLIEYIESGTANLSYTTIDKIKNLLTNE